MKRLAISRADVVVIAVALLLSIVGFYLVYATGGGVVAAVAVARHSGGQQRLSLATDASITIETDAGWLVLAVEGGAARVTQSDCPDGFCVSAGPLSRVGDTAVCLPLGIVITVEGNLKGGAADAVSW